MNFGSSETNGTNKQFHIDDVSNTVVSVFEIAVIPTIVCGNILIISAVCRFTWLRSPSNIMIAFLAGGDLMMGGLYLPLKLLFTYLFDSRASCLAYIFLSYLSVNSCMFFLSTLSLERFYAVQFPFHYHREATLARSVLGCLGVVALTLVVTLPILSGIDSWAQGKLCYSTNILPAYYVWTFTLVIFVMQLAGFFSFLRVLYAELRQKRRGTNLTDSRRQDSVKSTLMLVVYVISLVCWIPEFIYIFVSVFNPERTTFLGLRSVSLVGIGSSGLNFFVYGLKNSKFKKAFKVMCGCPLDRSVQPETVTE